jgi:hypothetical protein
MRINLSMPPDRDGFVAEIWNEEEHFGEIYSSDNKIIFEIYPRRDGKPWKLEAEALQVALASAMKRLSE